MPHGLLAVENHLDPVGVQSVLDAIRLGYDRDGTPTLRIVLRGLRQSPGSVQINIGLDNGQDDCSVILDVALVDAADSVGETLVLAVRGRVDEPRKIHNGKRCLCGARQSDLQDFIRDVGVPPLAEDHDGLLDDAIKGHG